MTHMLTLGEAPYTNPEFDGIFNTRNLFVGGNTRKAVNRGQNDYVPIFFGEVPEFLRSGRYHLNVCLLQLSPPDEHGFCTLGASIDCTRAAAECADVVVAEINSQMPRCYGDSLIHMSHLDKVVYVDRPIPKYVLPEQDEVQMRIGKLIADNLVEDGSTLQAGIGVIPDSVMANLKGHKGLGVHSEMFSDGMIDLIQSGAITNEFKPLDRGCSTTCFVMGTEKTYKFVHNNPSIQIRDVGFTNDPFVIAQMPKMVAINSAIEIDLTGQIVSDSIGPRIFSGFGGQVDFIYGASRSKGGKPIIAMPSTTKKGESKIVGFLKQGAGVVTTRAHVRFVVTEYGIADLYGKSLRERARALIDIAHPKHRESLEKTAREQLGLRL
ncbi:Acetate:succinate CoA Transferase (ASCT) [Blastocystis hominis]|uniref:Acetate:succinate CoA Transferase (ASCT) n=1 Tax=Blastocystis hominis TaxID=12968 RepID=D8M5Z7_BLAHO|nr:Acetate:succinate CoA Transferase (ASCT) [Blastocystis hominis]CBK23596.2 Acetate:succinate CoA Transferase (ASCT) [Blastocystis hominis]|eukprot:XP_012897644.1 Acetate:succinate CoA Transferase (ASCT) [Blastocystis hominis]